jgi:hypothetical protein
MTAEQLPWSDEETLMLVFQRMRYGGQWRRYSINRRPPHGCRRRWLRIRWQAKKIWESRPEDFLTVCGVPNPETIIIDWDRLVSNLSYCPLALITLDRSVAEALYRERCREEFGEPCAERIFEQEEDWLPSIGVSPMGRK